MGECLYHGSQEWGGGGITRILFSRTDGWAYARGEVSITRGAYKQHFTVC